MVQTERPVYGGVDTHKDFHVAAVVDEAGRILATSSFTATAAGYRQLLSWLCRHGDVIRVGVEGTGSYGLGLARHLAEHGVDVVEVNRPNRQARRRRGKNDVVDAEAAARAALNGDAMGRPKDHDGTVESLRVLRIAFTSSRNTRTKVINQIHALVVCAPDALRRELENLDNTACVERCARFRPGDTADPAEATKTALRTLARQHQGLTADIETIRADLDRLTKIVNPALCAVLGVGSDVASILLIAAGDNPERLTSDAAFAALCGASPIEASSGKTVRHRLNQGGNRQANHALWRIVMVRLSADPRTKAYVERRRAEGRSTREIIRCLKRYIAREIFHHLTNPQPLADAGPALRNRRLALNLTQADVAHQLGTNPSRISNAETGYRGGAHNITRRYTAWLDQHEATCAA